MYFVCNHSYHDSDSQIYIYVNAISISITFIIKKKSRAARGVTAYPHAVRLPMITNTILRIVTASFSDIWQSLLNINIGYCDEIDNRQWITKKDFKKNQLFIDTTLSIGSSYKHNFSRQMSLYGGPFVYSITKGFHWLSTNISVFKIIWLCPSRCPNWLNVFDGHCRYRTAPTITVDKRARAGFSLDVVHFVYRTVAFENASCLVSAFRSICLIVFVPHHFDLSVSCGWCFVYRRTCAMQESDEVCLSILNEIEECLTQIKRMPFPPYPIYESKYIVYRPYPGSFLGRGTRWAGTQGGKIWIRGGGGVSFVMLMFYYCRIVGFLGFSISLIWKK